MAHPPLLLRQGGGGRPPLSPRAAARRRRVLTRAVPLVVIAAGAFTAGIVSATGPGRAERQLVTRYVRAWARGDYPQMYSLLDPASKARLTEPEFASQYQAAAQTASVTSIQPGRLSGRQGDVIPVTVRVNTNSSGPSARRSIVPLSGSGSDARVHFAGEAAVPGSATRRDAVAQRDAPASGRTAGPRRHAARAPGRGAPRRSQTWPARSPAGSARSRPTRRRRTRPRDTRPTPRSASTASSASSRTSLAGTPGGTLLAGAEGWSRTADPVAGPTVTTTIDPRDRARGGHGDRRPLRRDRGDGPAHRPAARARRVRVLGAAAARLDDEDHHRHRRARGRDRQADRHVPDPDLARRSTASSSRTPTARRCGGTFLNAFAVSCNSVFAPLGAKLGRGEAGQHRRALRLQPAAVDPRRGREPDPRGRATIGDALAVGSSAIGQGKVQASALEMTDVAATIAMGGRRPVPTLLRTSRPTSCASRAGHVPSSSQRMMVAVVSVRDRHRRLRSPASRWPARPGPPSSAIRPPPPPTQMLLPQLAAEHRLVVRRLRAGRRAPRGRRRPVPDARRRRDHGSAGDPRCARRRAAVPLSGAAAAAAAPRDSPTTCRSSCRSARARTNRHRSRARPGRRRRRSPRPWQSGTADGPCRSPASSRPSA